VVATLKTGDPVPPQLRWVRISRWMAIWSR
jgi:hypothetical protein